MFHTMYILAKMQDIGSTNCYHGKENVLFQSRNKPVWRLSAVTDCGTVRKLNQDNMYVMEPVVSRISLGHYVVTKECEESIMIAVCDGMGGEMWGEKASYLACRVLEQSDWMSYAKLSTTELERKLVELMNRMNACVYDTFVRDSVFVGSTVVLLYADEIRTMVVNVGDSICIRMTESDSGLVTIPDNQANWLYERGEITEEQRWRHKSKSRLTQCLGMNPEEFQLRPHVYVADAMQKNETYLLASDGLVDGLPLSEIYCMMRQNPTPSVANALVEAAKAGGSHDNITALFVKRR